jgi:hypothetical protein
VSPLGEAERAAITAVCARDYVCFAVNLFSYVVRDDTGFAPNPFHGCCTLAYCKGRIRRQVGVGDLIVGLSRRSERVVHAMRVDRWLRFAD